MKPKVFIPEPIAPNGMDLLRGECECWAPWETGAEPHRSLLYSADAIIVRLFKIDRDDIAEAKDLKVIAKHGVGLDNIDCTAASEFLIPVVYTPTANANAVAEHTIGLMLALVRGIAPASKALEDGRFDQRGRFLGIELAGKTLGVIGLGRVGSIVAQIAALGLKMNVIGFDPFVAEGSYKGPAQFTNTLKDLLRQSDFISLHVSLTPETRNMINARTLALVKPGCRLINTSRGAVIDEEALVQALVDRKLGGAALDVFAAEPLPPNHPLLKTPNTLLTPHISSTTVESLDRMSLQAAQGVLDVLHGQNPQYIFNPEVLP
jgi:D-3-phosphoglycerate dehydrogenase